MRQAKLLGLALVAVFVLSAAAFSSIASALEPIKILPVENAGLNWTGETDEKNPQLIALGGTIQCEKAEANGTEEKTHPLGEFHIHFLNCKNTATGVECNSLGDKPGIILVLGTWHLVYDVVEKELDTATLFLPLTVHFECTSFFLIEVKGELVCLDLQPLSKLLSHLFHCHQKEALQLEKIWWNDLGETTKHEKAELLCNENHTEFKHCAELALGLVKHGAEIFADD